MDSIADVVADADLAEALALSSALAESATGTSTRHSPQDGALTSQVQTSISDSDSVIEIDSDSDSGVEGMIAERLSSSTKGRWCPACTYLNPPQPKQLSCSMCDAQLPVSPVSPPEVPWPCSVCTLENRAGAPRCEACDFPKDRRDWTSRRRSRPEQGVDERAPGISQPVDGTWTCELCTLVNVRASRVCSICEGPCPLIVPQSSGPAESVQRLSSGNKARAGKARAVGPPNPPPWDCQNCGQRGIAHEFWMCGMCGWIKTGSSVAG